MIIFKLLNIFRQQLIKKFNLYQPNKMKNYSAQQNTYRLLIILWLLLSFTTGRSQSITIKEEVISIPTYDFGKGNPVPILAENPKIYPYFKFETYEQVSKNKDWKVVTLENDYIKVMVLPEIGGKVWGAIEKSTGEEFLYKNEVVKFRNIAMRGPWTSGGIEFNFGIIGHHPSTATPVDFITRTNADGSVSCIVANTDLPSNTNWTVEIRLEKDKAYFETNASWYNASPLTESYYNWMTAAAVASNDLEFFIPGNAYVEHGGNAHSWPIDDKNRDLSLYKNNNFGPSKSYHIVGEYNDFFGGYYHDRKFGFGQWAPYEEMPGQKLWLWALSRAGGIWEDLLTDSDGQYIEFQAGRLFDQYFPGDINPISQVGFDPFVMDRWSEIWFPYKEIGGMEDASKHGVLNVETNNGATTVGINALQQLNTKLHVKIDGQTYTENLALQPMQVFTKKFPASTTAKIEVSVDGTELSYTNDPEANAIKRPFHPDENLKISQSEQLYFDGCEALEYRAYALAHKKLSELITLDPSHQAGLVKLAELEYRRTNYDRALELANTVLRMDTYNSGANYMAGIAYRAKKDTINALESLGWAARDIKYRSVAFAQMAALYLADKNYDRAQIYAHKALDFNTYNMNARQVLLLTHSTLNNKEAFKKAADDILTIEPINHFVSLERGRVGDLNKTTAVSNIQNEFKEETLLSNALRYRELGFSQAALETLSLGFESPKNMLWKAYLIKEQKPEESTALLSKMLQKSVDFVFPYRRETIPVLEWAISINPHWKLQYYLAQNYIAVGLKDKGTRILNALENTPDAAVFYRFRAQMATANTEIKFPDAHIDLKRALELSPNDWKIWEENILLNNDIGNYEVAYSLSKKAYKKYPKNYAIGLAHAKSLLNNQRYAEILDVMANINVLPYEHANESREIYERAHLSVALAQINKKKYQKALTVLEKAKQWPEHIGVGKPYDADERAVDYLRAVVLEKLGKPAESKNLLTAIVDFTAKHADRNTPNHLFGLLAAKKTGKETQQIEQKLSMKAEKNTRTQIALDIFNKKTNTMKSTDELPVDVRNLLLAAQSL